MPFIMTCCSSRPLSFVSDMLEELRDAEFHHMKMIEKKIGSLELG